jgi:hypothetical protein
MLDVATRWAVSAAVTVYLRALICDLYILTGVRYYAGRSSVGTAVLLQREVMSLSPDVRGDPERAVMFGGWYPPIFTFDDRKVRDLYVLGDIYGLIEQVRLAKQPDEPLCRLWVLVV